MPDDVILVRAWSGPWETAAERTGFALAEVAVYRDGTVLADISPVADARDVRAVQLREAELEELLAGIAEASPVPVDRASSLRFNSGCADAGVQVIWVRSGGRPVEQAVYCLDTRFLAPGDAVPESAVALSRILDDLQLLVEEGPHIATDKLMPLVPAAPFVGG